MCVCVCVCVCVFTVYVYMWQCVRLFMYVLKLLIRVCAVSVSLFMCVYACMRVHQGRFAYITACVFVSLFRQAAGGEAQGAG